MIVSDPKAFELAKKYHPNWDKLTEWGQKLQARNSHQILGNDLNTKSTFVICWTRNGKGGGGTGQAIRIANDYSIPVFDCGLYKDLNECRVELKKFLDIHMK